MGKEKKIEKIDESFLLYVRYIHTRTFKYHFHRYTYMARDKKSENPIKNIMPKKSHSLYLGLATPGILHEISDQKKQ